MNSPAPPRGNTDTNMGKEKAHRQRIAEIMGGIGKLFAKHDA
jgi:hypothetical protein